MIAPETIQDFRNERIALHIRSREELQEAVDILNKGGIGFDDGFCLPSWKDGFLVLKDGCLRQDADTSYVREVLERWKAEIVEYSEVSGVYRIRLPKGVTI